VQPVGLGRLCKGLYRGEISHKGSIYAGEYAAIIDAELWDAVQAKLAEHRTNRSDGPRGTMPSPLTGLIYDDAGERLIPRMRSKAASATAIMYLPA
jgi:site-specific DNA recombinase